MFHFHLCYVLIFRRKKRPFNFRTKTSHDDQILPQTMMIKVYKTGGRHLRWSFGLPLFWIMPTVINGVMMPLEMAKNKWALGVKQPLWIEFIPSLKLINIAPKNKLGPTKGNESSSNHWLSRVNSLFREGKPTHMLHGTCIFSLHLPLFGLNFWCSCRLPYVPYGAVIGYRKYTLPETN